MRAHADAEALEAAVRRTSGLFLDRRAWTRMQRNGMVTDVSWRGPARLLVERATR
jgi:starch synthase